MESGKMTSLAGLWVASIDNDSPYDMRIPGTLDANNIGFPDHPGPLKLADPAVYAELQQKGLGRFSSSIPEIYALEGEESFDDVPILSRYRRRHTYTGPVRISKSITYHEKPGKRLFLEVERARVLRLYIDGREVSHYSAQSMSAPHVFEVTGLLNGNHMISFITDNRYPLLPAEEILASSMASDEAQSNWNGLLGFVRLREEQQAFAERLSFQVKGRDVTGYLEIDALEPGNHTVRISSDILVNDFEEIVHVENRYSGFRIAGLRLKDGLKPWDEGDGQLYKISLFLDDEEKKVPFSFRSLGKTKSGHLTVNGRSVFLRGDTCHGVFPESGYMPCDKYSWEKIIKAYRAYGVNCLRFHTCCPPEAAFQAADEMGFFMIPELSLWAGTEVRIERLEKYYTAELTRLLRTYGHHPSFIMLSLGLCEKITEEVEALEKKLLDLARSISPDRLYAGFADPDHGEKGPDDFSDFYAAEAYKGTLLGGNARALDREEGLRGHVNTQYPDNTFTYDDVMQDLKTDFRKPVIAVNAGQYAVLPDLKELDLFSGSFGSDRLEDLFSRAEDLGLRSSWNRYVEASGERALLCWKLETEAFLRTGILSGFMMQSLADFPGRGMAFTGMMNSHCVRKPFEFTDPARFRSFLKEAGPLAELQRYTYENGEEISFRALFFNYSKETIVSDLKYRLKGENMDIRGSLDEKQLPVGNISSFGKIKIKLSEENGFDPRLSQKLTLTLSVGKLTNEYPIWVYPALIPVCPEHVYETSTFDLRAMQILEEGGTVFFTPPATKEAIPASVKTNFGGDYWTSSRYTLQSGTLGQLVDADHPVFKKFPTDRFTDLQWWTMANARAVVLPKRMKTIVSEIDSPDYLRNLGKLFEFRMLRGNVLFSSMGLKENIQYPEVRALLAGIYDYLDSFDFSPAEELRPEEVRAMIRSAEH